MADAAQTDTIDYTVPDWCLSYLINGDASGVEDGDLEVLQAFERQALEDVAALGQKHLVWSTEGEASFTCYNDVTCLGDNCVTLHSVIIGGQGNAGDGKDSDASQGDLFPC